MDKRLYFELLVELSNKDTSKDTLICLKQWKSLNVLPNVDYIVKFKTELRKQKDINQFLKCYEIWPRKLNMITFCSFESVGLPMTGQKFEVWDTIIRYSQLSLWNNLMYVCNWNNRRRNDKHYNNKTDLRLYFTWYNHYKQVFNYIRMSEKFLIVEVAHQKFWCRSK
jgi:hypothetical protein